jgi:hypothetical protein
MDAQGTIGDSIDGGGEGIEGALLAIEEAFRGTGNDDGWMTKKGGGREGGQPTAATKNADKEERIRRDEEAEEEAVPMPMQTPTTTPMILPQHLPAKQQQQQQTPAKKLTRNILPTQMEDMHNMDQFYVNLNTIEEYMDQPESLPYEGLEEKEDILKVQ